MIRLLRDVESLVAMMRLMCISLQSRISNVVLDLLHCTPPFPFCPAVQIQVQDLLMCACASHPLWGKYQVFEWKLAVPLS